MTEQATTVRGRRRVVARQRAGITPSRGCPSLGRVVPDGRSFVEGRPVAERPVMVVGPTSPVAGPVSRRLRANGLVGLAERPMTTGRLVGPAVVGRPVETRQVRCREWTPWTARSIEPVPKAAWPGPWSTMPRWAPALPPRPCRVAGTATSRWEAASLGPRMAGPWLVRPWPVPGRPRLASPWKRD